MNESNSTMQSRGIETAAAPVTTQVFPAKTLTTLSREEMARLGQAGREVGGLLRRCALAVLSSGTFGDDADQMLNSYKDFRIFIQPVNRGIRLDLTNAPGCAFVDGKMIRGIRELLFSVVRDIVYYHTDIKPNPQFDQNSSGGLTNIVFEILRNARALELDRELNLVVCWGGHSISEVEYDYTKEVGYQLGLRGYDICTGCGPGAMKGPMKGATIGHAKQRTLPGRYVGISEPGIIAAESPNPIVNELIIMPDIEKRLEAFVRLGHGIIVFPGGVGTTEEILYLLGLLLHPDNADLPYPLVFTGPSGSADYFEEIDAFIRLTLGEEARQRYRIVIDDPAEVARHIGKGLQEVREFRTSCNDAYYYNWRLHIDESFQHPFVPTHENMRELVISRGLPVHELAANLRCAFSGIVAGNVKANGIRAVREQGPFEIQGESELMRALDSLLERFVRQRRMKLPGAEYVPCYRVVQ